MTDVTPADGLDEGDGVTLSWPPLDEDGAAITGSASAITLTIVEPGQTPITKTGGDLTEDPSGTYKYVHKVTAAAAGGRTYGKWVYDGPGNNDGAQQFFYDVRASYS